MEFIFELIIELLLEGATKVSSNNKISKWIRYPILFLLSFFYLAIILLIIFVGLLLFEENILAAIFFIALGIFFLIFSVKKFKSVYLERTNESNNN